MLTHGAARRCLLATLTACAVIHSVVSFSVSSPMHRGGASVRSQNLDAASLSSHPSHSLLAGVGLRGAAAQRRSDFARLRMVATPPERGSKVSPKAAPPPPPVARQAPPAPAAASSPVPAARSSGRPVKPVTIVVFGASGDLAKKKTFPALFSLFYHNLLPEEFQIIGYARKDLDEQAFRESLMEMLSCRVDPETFDSIEGQRCAELMDEFMGRVSYFSGGYDDEEAVREMGSKAVTDFEDRHKATGVDRLYYLAIPPTVFADSARSIARGGKAPTGDTRVVIEKPFGRDSASYEKLSVDLAKELSEEEIYRIDHYLGKELVQNIMAMRFGNFIFEPLWDSRHIDSVQIDFKEPFGVEGRAGYFDNSGIVRDIMQNHLMQVLALLAMEAPASMDADDVRDEKVKLLRSVETLSTSDFCLGQYAAAGTKPGYHDDEEVPEGSRTPTFAACAFAINNRRWDGVPFLMRAGKALDERLAQVRIRFKQVPGGLFSGEDLDGERANELVIRLQPDEAIYLTVVNKVPGLTNELTRTKLDLSYRSEWADAAEDMPDAYERLILDALNGEKALFCRDDELREAWRVFSSALEKMESDESVTCADYAYGSDGPAEMHKLAEERGVEWA